MVEVSPRFGFSEEDWADGAKAAALADLCNRAVWIGVKLGAEETRAIFIEHGVDVSPADEATGELGP